MSMWPWSAISEARWAAENLLVANQWLRKANADLRGDIVELRRANDELRVERDVARAKLERRSAGISRGNRTKALRRRGGLLPAPINEPDQSRTSLTG